MQDRRTEVRMLCADVIEVCWTDNRGKKHHGTGLLEDISESGACLQMDRAVPLHANVSWHVQDRHFSGEVRYCIYREVGYFVGVEFAPGTKWSPEAFHPSHLLDVRDLALDQPAKKIRDTPSITGLIQ